MTLTHRLRVVQGWQRQALRGCQLAPQHVKMKLQALRGQWLAARGERHVLVVVAWGRKGVQEAVVTWTTIHACHNNGSWTLLHP